MKLHTEQTIQNHLQALLTLLDDKKAIELITLDIRDKSSVADYFVVCSGTSSPHTRALSNEIQAYAKEQALEYSVEGTREGKWVLFDLGFIVVHIMHESLREFYNLEQLWRPSDEDEN